MVPPRAVFVNYPLGHPVGKPNDPASQRAILLAALNVLVTATEPGTLVELPFKWDDQDPDDTWEATARVH